MASAASAAGFFDFEEDDELFEPLTFREVLAEEIPQEESETTDPGKDDEGEESGR